jgi:hypothetical protein
MTDSFVEIAERVYPALGGDKRPVLGARDADLHAAKVQRESTLFAAFAGVGIQAP